MVNVSLVKYVACAYTNKGELIFYFNITPYT